MRAEDSRAARSKYERMPMELTRADLRNCAVFDDDGFVLHSLPSPAGGRGAGGEGDLCTGLIADIDARKNVLLREIDQRNLGYFEQEVQKLDAWADDLKLGLEQEIKEVRRAAATSPTLEEKLSWQKK
jgi:hypothetical protein